MLTSLTLRYGNGASTTFIALKTLGVNHGKRVLFKFVDDQVMVGMVKILIGFNIIISFKFYQVSPLESQELYLNSLESVNIDPKKNDIKFIEDDWESPTLGAIGLGWEVQCNGMEISQFTYFQQIGGFECKPVSLELTYGLERLAMFVQDVDNVFEIIWDNNGTSMVKFLKKTRKSSHIIIFCMPLKKIYTKHSKI